MMVKSGVILFSIVHQLPKFCDNSWMRKQETKRIRKPTFQAQAVSTTRDYLFLPLTEGNTPRMKFVLSSYPWSGQMLHLHITTTKTYVSDDILIFNFSKVPVTPGIFSCLHPRDSTVLSLKLKGTSLKDRNVYLGRVVQRVARTCTLTTKDMSTKDLQQTGWCTDPILLISTDIYSSLFQLEPATLFVALPNLGIPVSAFHTANPPEGSRKEDKIAIVFHWQPMQKATQFRTYSHDKGRQVSFEAVKDNGKAMHWMKANHICHVKGFTLPTITDEDKAESLKTFLLSLEHHLMMLETNLLSISLIFIGLVLKVSLFEDGISEMLNSFFNVRVFKS